MRIHRLPRPSRVQRMRAMAHDRLRPWQLDIEATDRARLVRKAVPVDKPLKDRYAWSLGQRIFEAATCAGSIAGARINEQNLKVLAEIDWYGRTWLHAEACLAAEKEQLEGEIERRTRIYAKCKKAFGSPQYIFIGKLGAIYQRYTGDPPGRHKGGGPFVRFVEAAVEQFGEGFELRGNPADTVRRALARSKTWKPKDLWALKY